MRLALFFALLLGACGARFVDERPDLQPPPDLSIAGDASP
jgi:hypothetical protein